MPRREKMDPNPENFWAEYRRSGDSAPRDALLENYLPLVAAALARLGSLGTDRRLETIAIETLAGVISRRQRMGSSGFVTKASRGISRALSRAIGENAAFSKQVEKAKVRVDKVWDRLLADGDGEPEPENFLGSVSGNPREAQDLLLLARLSDGAVDVTASSKLLADMSAEEKCIIQMLYGEELTQKEVSAAIGIPEAMVVSIEGMILARLRRGSRDVDNSSYDRHHQRQGRCWQDPGLRRALDRVGAPGESRSHRRLRSRTCQRRAPLRYQPEEDSPASRRRWLLPR